MKIVKDKIKKPIEYKFKFELSQEEAIGIVNELGKMECKMNYNRTVPIPMNYWARLFMTLSDILQDLGLIEMIKGRNKGDKSRPRLKNDKILTKEITKFAKQKSSEVKKNGN